MKIIPDTNDPCRVSLGTISRSYERVGKNPSVYPYFERVVRPALRGCRLQFQRDSGEYSIFSR